jgi:hypothetical protein
MCTPKQSTRGLWQTFYNSTTKALLNETINNLYKKQQEFSEQKRKAFKGIWLHAIEKYVRKVQRDQLAEGARELPARAHTHIRRWQRSPMKPASRETSIIQKLTLRKPIATRAAASEDSSKVHRTPDKELEEPSLSISQLNRLWLILVVRSSIRSAIIHFHLQKDAGLNLAIEFVNKLLEGEGYPPITSLDDLSKYGDGPRKQVPRFPGDGSDESLVSIANSFLRNRKIPIREQIEPTSPTPAKSFADLSSSELNTITRHIDLLGALSTLPRPRIGCLQSVISLGMDVYVNARRIDELVAPIMQSLTYPITLNVVSDEDAAEILGPSTFDDFAVFDAVTVEKLNKFERIECIGHVSYVRIDFLLVEFLDDIEIPITENDVDEYACRQIASIDEYLDAMQSVSKVTKRIECIRSDDSLDDREPEYEEILPLELFEIKDSQFYLNNGTTDELLDRYFDRKPLPIKRNGLTAAMITQIFNEDYSRHLPPFSAVDVEHVRDFEWRFAIDGRLVKTAMNTYINSNISGLPVTSNGISQAAADRIASIFDFEFSDRPCPVEDCTHLQLFTIIHEDRYANEKAADEWLDDILDGSDLPVLSNIPTTDLADAILDVFVSDITDVSVVAIVSIHGIDLEPCDVTHAVDSAVVEDFISRAAAGIQFPVVSNYPDDEVAFAIANFDPDFTILFPGDDEPIRHYDSKDIQFFVNDVVVDTVLTFTLDDFDRELPFVANSCPKIAIDAIASLLDVTENPELAAVDLKFVDALDPVNRRIDFCFDCSPESLFPHRFPLTPNSVSSVASVRILEALDSLDLGDVAFGENANDAKILREFVAPPEEMAALDALAERLVGQLLKIDIHPELPFEEMIVINNGTADAAIAGFFDEILALNRVFEGAQTAIGCIAPKEIPTVVTPEEIVEEILWEDALPELPLDRRGAFERFLDSIFDEDDD